MQRTGAADRVCRAASSRVRAQLETGLVNGTPGERFWLTAQLALLEERAQEAVDPLQQAVQRNPLKVEWRLDLAILLLRLNELETAERQLAFAAKMSPRREDIARLLQQTRIQRLRQSPQP